MGEEGGAGYLPLEGEVGIARVDDVAEGRSEADLGERQNHGLEALLALVDGFGDVLAAEAVPNERRSGHRLLRDVSRSFFEPDRHRGVVPPKPPHHVLA